MLLIISFFIFTLLNFVSDVAALTRDLHIVNANIAPDGFTRATVLAEGVFPGPLLIGNISDFFAINVTNELTNSSMDLDTSIHWHGLFQQGTAWSDGPSSVTQCPIIPGNWYQYNFSVPGQSGTYWYHSHYSLQYCDGLRGPMILYDPNDPLQSLYDVDDETTVITLADWYHVPAALADFRPDSTLINGLGRYPGNLTAPLSIINVKQGLRYRFRLISISCDPSFDFSIDNHNLTVIEADGVETKPVVVDSIEIYASQRYSFILFANQSINNYWIRARPNAGNRTFVGGLNSAILRYAGASNSEPSGITLRPGRDPNPLVETNLHPLISVPVPGGKGIGQVDQTINLDFAFNGANYSVNGVVYDFPQVPVLLQILSGQINASQILPPGGVIPIPLNSSIEIYMPGGVNFGPHPLHLHGHTFHVIRSAGNSTYNFDDPVIRDTVSTGGAGDNVTIRFQTNNQGPWFLHCHIEFHLNAGFATVLAEDIQGIATNTFVPPSWEQLCPSYWNQSSGSSLMELE